MSKTQTDQIPNSACQLRAFEGGAVRVEEGQFTLSGYRVGQQVEHPWWGKFVFETSTMTMNKGKIPVTVDHNTSKGCGFATGMSIEDGSVNFPGEFVKNEHSEYVQSFKGTDMFQCSVQFDPLTTKFQWVEENEVVDVDGIEHEGPLVVFKDSSIIEVAFTLLPAVPDTSSSFSQPSFHTKENTMAEDKAKLAEAQTLGQNETLARFNRMSAMSENKELVATCFSKGMSVEDFSAEVTKDLHETNTRLSADLETANARIEELEAENAQFKTSGEGVEPVGSSAAPEATAEPKDFMGKVAKFAADNSVSKGVAFKSVLASDPEGYEAYRQNELGISKGESK